MTLASTFDAGGWFSAARQIPSPNQDQRPAESSIDLVVVHSISLPPGEFGGDAILQLFTNTLDPAGHPYFETIKDLRVSAHFLIRRDGELIQFVPVQQRAWHAGASRFEGRERCNDFSIGIELEGTDEDVFADIQYRVLIDLLRVLVQHFSVFAIAAHSEIAPSRKTDPGPHFDWHRINVEVPSLRRMK